MDSKLKLPVARTVHPRAGLRRRIRRTTSGISSHIRQNALFVGPNRFLSKWVALPLRPPHHRVREVGRRICSEGRHCSWLTKLSVRAGLSRFDIIHQYPLSALPRRSGMYPRRDRITPGAGIRRQPGKKHFGSEAYSHRNKAVTRPAPLG
jgi:hypothetical protein